MMTTSVLMEREKMKEHPYDKYDPWQYNRTVMEMIKAYQDIIDQDHQSMIDKSIERIKYISKYEGYELLISDAKSGVFDFIIKILEQNKRRKPIPESGYIRYACPVCKSIVYNDYCGACGQALDWSIE